MSCRLRDCLERASSRKDTPSTLFLSSNHRAFLRSRPYKDLLDTRSCWPTAEGSLGKEKTPPAYTMPGSSPTMAPKCSKGCPLETVLIPSRAFPISLSFGEG